MEVITGGVIPSVGESDANTKHVFFIIFSSVLITTNCKKNVCKGRHVGCVPKRMIFLETH